MRRFISMMLVLVMSLVLSAQAFAVERDIPTDSAAGIEAAGIEIVGNSEGAERLESDIARNAQRPKEYHDLSKLSYSVDGTFEVFIYTLCYFKPNASGKINYSVVVTWEDEFSEYPILPSMTVECWDRTTGKQVTTATFESETDVWPFVPVMRSGSRTVSGLNTDHEYYFVFRKDITGALARVTGRISHYSV